MRAPHGAVQADQLHEIMLRRAMRPPQKRRSPALGGTRHRADLKAQQDTALLRLSDAAAQRAIAAAQRRADDLIRRAALRRAIGLGDAALRAEAIAAGLRDILT
jgi:hypothetical protein